MNTDELKQKAASLVGDYLGRHFEISAVVATLVATRCKLVITGGAVRSALLCPGRYSDLDLIVSADTTDELTRLGLAKTTTQYGDARVFWNRLPVDLMIAASGTDFRAEAARIVRTFDLEVNAITYDPRTQTIHDELDTLAHVFAKRIRLHKPTWTGVKDAVIANQAVRLAKLLYEVPDLRIEPEDLAWLETDVLAVVQRAPWEDMQIRYPLGREHFVEQFTRLLHRQQG